MSELAIMSLFDKYKTYVADKDIVLLMSLYGDDIRAFDTWGVWVYEGIDKWREMNEKWFQSLGADKDVVEFDEIIVSSNDNMGMASAIATYSAVSGTGSILRSMQTRLTWVTKRYATDWKIIHQHTSVPIDGRTIGAILTR